VWRGWRTRPSQVSRGEGVLALLPEGARRRDALNDLACRTLVFPGRLQQVRSRVRSQRKIARPGSRLRLIIPDIVSRTRPWRQLTKLANSATRCSLDVSTSAPIEAISLQGQLDLVANSDSSFLLAPLRSPSARTSISLSRSKGVTKRQHLARHSDDGIAPGGDPASGDFSDAIYVVSKTRSRCSVVLATALLLVRMRAEVDDLSNRRAKLRARNGTRQAIDCAVPHAPPPVHRIKLLQEREITLAGYPEEYG
jgi:hypothetical protein